MTNVHLQTLKMVCTPPMPKKRLLLAELWSNGSQYPHKLEYRNSLNKAVHIISMLMCVTDRVFLWYKINQDRSRVTDTH